MAQVLFSAATTPQLTDLDANFTDLYTRAQLLQSTSNALGIGVTPSTWTGTSNLEMAGGGNVAFAGNGVVASNAFFNAGWKYKTTGAAAKYDQGSGTHFWSIAASGTAGNAITWTQAMTLDASGNLLVGTSTAPSGVAGDPVGGAITPTGVGLFTRSSSNAVVYVNNKQAGAVSLVQFYSGGAAVGSITSNGTNTAYNTSSDYRLKDSVAPLSGSGAFIDALNPVRFNWKHGGAPGAGFLAHELQAVSPSSVHGSKDAIQEVGDVKDATGFTLASEIPQPDALVDGQTWTQTGFAPVYQAVEYGSAELIAMLVAELKAVRARLSTLEGH